MQVCENYIDAEKIPEHFPGAVKTDDVLSLETVVLGSLGFDLVVYHPYSFLDAMLEVCTHCQHHFETVLALLSST